MGRSRRQVAAEVVTEARHPSGYAEGMRQENPQQDQMEGNSRQRGERTTYGSHVIRHRDELTKMSQEIERYDAEEHWHFGLDASTWSIEAIGGGIWLTALYICKRAGRPHQSQWESESRSEEKRRGISLEYRRLSITGKYMRHRWISPFDLWGAFMWRPNRQRRVEKSEENGGGEVRLVRETIGNGT